ncbi:MBL fold metallo-hydrolase [Planosporangium mesophilum]|uniref:MBL fold metallo-hydrolase n=1 Tax=Planosporangium mesophilum TaxID=689768 RepID=A0A8J3T9Y7_9ACTN|nr:MBL fold metallo-hydrolase [Planosporangium mesophilum]NJC83358.1 MBL fold metallo-hydrolase [Planosporangium mesophilum]GII21736.1 MBL fold metallo-hydrolase [Planosporangium mesophilum]
MTGFTEVARDVYVLRYPVLDVNATLVVGDGAALLVDTLSTDAQARELRDAVRAVTPYPLTVVNTHHHFDHCFGNAVVVDADRPIWAHEEAARILCEEAAALQRELYPKWAPIDPELAAGLAAVRVRPPDHTVHLEATLDIGGRPVVLRHLGRGHSVADLVVHVADVDVLIAGDLVEEGAPPNFDDGYPLEWPATVFALLELASPATVVVPGHGAVVDSGFVRAQHADLTTLEWLIRDGHTDAATVDEVATLAPFGPDAARVAVRRGYAELAGRAT